ncbi:alpha/beta fold hydrolase [Nocardioides lianchengensis]|uniref:Pimeloyl-ACP methyl ester carboxylesterase n=1 Tax=Nocardioides lianchengensis TaxID=1045774 RepID=A0A1G6RHC3_9ACTN|nr:alpha/beta fold hydrolase [Nocardioides lianchengensis]NYG10235.1 pimeloyl-ACP methyl ester carboxylesterase [Nocardioides lianchengensis]SDD03968.1 Pimeloyl-ACP methyl ester carboxylesterase [Nocardioides lianchengensis]
MGLLSPRDLLRRSVYMPWARIPPGRTVELGGRGTTYVTDTPGPTPDAPTIVLLHALGCTGLLTWYPAIEPLSRRFRVVTLDQRWHGQGIRSDEFSLYDCADDVAALLDVLELESVVVAGYSMGGVVAQRMWRQHPDRVQGLVLAATSDRFQLNLAERAFFTGMGTAMLGTRSLSRSRTAVRAARTAVRALSLEPSDIHDWAMHEFRSTSPWAVGQALAALGRHHSRPWLGRIDVPTAVVVTGRDHIIPPARQVALARAIPGATVHDLEGGHAACVLEAERFVPVVVEAAVTVWARRRDFARGAS